MIPGRRSGSESAVVYRQRERFRDDRSSRSSGTLRSPPIAFSSRIGVARARRLTRALEQTFSGVSQTVLLQDARTDKAVTLCGAHVERLPSVVARSSALACFFHEDGRVEAVRHAFERLATRGFESVPRNEVWNIATSMLSMVCAWLYDRERAKVLY
jgi:hypothetical protein